MNKRQIVPFLLLLMVFLLWLYLKPEAILPKEPKHQLNYIAYNASNIHFDETGKISYKIFSEKTTGFAEKDITIFENLKLIVYVANEKNSEPTVWQLTSDNGLLYKQNRLVLSKNVWLENLSQDQLVQTMTTDKLTVLLDKKEINSDRLVTWQGPQMRQQGVGMWASLVTEELIVKDKIKAVYLNENK
jgi:lipopolysaccharide export system protein LptC